MRDTQRRDDGEEEGRDAEGKEEGGKKARLQRRVACVNLSLLLWHSHIRTIITHHSAMKGKQTVDSNWGLFYLAQVFIYLNYYYTRKESVRGR